MRNHVIAIDGPAASGKSTTARQVAERLGFVHVNSGLFYRAIAWASLRGGWSDDVELLREGVVRLDIAPVVEAGVLDVQVLGVRPGAALQARDVSARVSAVSATDVVRQRVLQLLRAAAEKADVVCDGRDIGTVVFPDARLKVFLVADVRERARRRLLDYDVEPSVAAIEEEAERLRARDDADSTRALAPLVKAADAVEIDTTQLAPDAVVQRILELAEERGVRAPQG
jgi:cytidylate kinase